VLLAFGVAANMPARAAQAAVDAAAVQAEGSFLDAQALFYNGHYDATAALSETLLREAPDDLRTYELRTTALLFQIKRAIGEAKDKDKAFKDCTTCPAIMAAFLRDTTQGLAGARARLTINPTDDNAQYFLGKLDLNHVWLHLGTLGHRTGWNEYWEARRSLDAVLSRNPRHARARIARAWIDYIVDTKMSWGTRWLLGGGDKKKALLTMRELADAPEDFYTSAEARFALWDVQVRERRFPEALATARELAVDFPRNLELTKFIDKHAPAATP
jgi:tetratricopeptide (TPR) repeat protein